MINCLNHHTSYNHSKFTARPTLTIALVKKASATWNKVNASVTASTKTPYQTKELLCWRFDKVFLNFQSSFLGLLKALHVCWAFARNNKRIVFVSSADNRLQEGMSLAIDGLLQSFPRDDLPRLKSRASSISQLHPPKTPKLKYQKKEKAPHSKLIALAHLMQLVVNNKSNDNALSKHKKAPVNSPVHHKLNGLLVKAATRRLTSSYSEVPPTFFSNTQKSFFDKFNHLAYIYSRPTVLKTTGNLLKQTTLDIYIQGLPNSQALDQPSLSKKKHVFNENTDTEDNIYDSKKPTQNVIAKTKNIKTEGVKKSTSPFKRWWGPNNYYGLRMQSQRNHFAKQRANNTHLNQADLVFFTDPDRNPGLANQIKKLGIPSIGIVSGLKTPTHYKIPFHSNLQDNVTYPIVGNPNSTNFVFLILRTFGLLIHSTYSRPKARHNPSCLTSLLSTKKDKDCVESAKKAPRATKKTHESLPTASFVAKQKQRFGNSLMAFLSKEKSKGQKEQRQQKDPLNMEQKSITPEWKMRFMPSPSSNRQPLRRLPALEKSRFPSPTQLHQSKGNLGPSTHQGWKPRQKKSQLPQVQSSSKGPKIKFQHESRSPSFGQGPSSSKKRKVLKKFENERGKNKQAKMDSTNPTTNNKKKTK